MTATSQAPNIELALGRVVVGYRVVGAAWLGILGLIALFGSTQPERPAVVVATMVGIAGWALLTWWTFRSHRKALQSWPWLGADVAVTVWTLFSSDAAGMDAAFYGGYPMSSVFLGVYTLAMAGGLMTAVALSTATVVRLVGSAGSDPTNDSAAVLIYLFGGVLAGWAVGVIRRSDRLRRNAESALADERASRARAEERAEVAAHLHDSVLQTLALIQKSGDSGEASALARRQERELRSWLFGAGGRTNGSFAAAVREMVAGIEDRFSRPIQTVVVGDIDLDEGLEAMIKAGREAVVNAVAHSGAGEISVYAEVGEGSVSLFVRDRGSGFDVESVPADRRGISESIVGRMERAGGRATVRSEPGRGTEVVLEREKA